MRNNKKAITVLALVTPVLLVTLAATAIAITRGAARSADATVEMTSELRYAPGRVTISVGETVTWSNTSDVPHTVTANGSLAADPAHVQLPEGAEPFDSDIIAPGESYSHTFTVAGEYRYVCVPHEGEGMLGTVIVQS